VIDARVVLCNGATRDDKSLAPERSWVELKLDASGNNKNVNLRIEDLTKVAVGRLPDRIHDLLEIAAYVFSADCAVSRGTGWVEQNSKEAWERKFHFAIAVRDLSFWQQVEVQDKLKALLNFIADDDFSFSFEKLTQQGGEQEYFDFSDVSEPLVQGIDRITMFSGGLDSLAGVLETLNDNEKTVLVSHRATPVIMKRQREIRQSLEEKFSKSLVHVQVQVNKNKGLDAEKTQRTRSFLFSALGVAVAEIFHVSTVRFYENGIVSLNLPVADEVLRARASRTTHPKGLHLLSEFYSLLTERQFKVDNPFVFNTKLEIIEKIVARGHPDLINKTCSCATPGIYASTQWHCGECSQCIDRRIAIIAAGQEEHDPEEDYVTNVFLGRRTEGYPKSMAVNYARHVLELFRMSEAEINQKFSNDLSRASRPFPQAREVAQQFISMHKRHAETAMSVFKKQLSENAAAIISGELDSTSMLAILTSKQHLQSSWKRCAESIASALRIGVPVACKTHPPKDEPHLQEICDGILKAENSKLVREFPFMEWATSKTKPDWSLESVGLWIELKYVRKVYGLSAIVKDIAEDITKYGDNNRKVLFVVYDPENIVKDERKFRQPIDTRPDMTLELIR
jgi:hypothetical protein